MNRAVRNSCPKTGFNSLGTIVELLSVNVSTNRAAGQYDTDYATSDTLGSAQVLDWESHYVIVNQKSIGSILTQNINPFEIQNSPES